MGDLDANHYERGMQHARQFEYDAAISEFDKAIVASPDHDRSYYARGLAWKKKGDLYKAIDDFEVALHINPNLRKAKEHRREAMVQLGSATHFARPLVRPQMVSHSPERAWSAKKPTERAAHKALTYSVTTTAIVWALLACYWFVPGFLLTGIFWLSSFSSFYKSFLKDETADAVWHDRNAN
ncbi:tetratricopeptide repeat protein [Bradyrhizobium sp. U531]|uniref:tetratricopeptide repeat protein n=1 Tax=Bradyrhizobium sp. U531 TaxID=3053458 RepID=UPI003F421948